MIYRDRVQEIAALVATLPDAGVVHHRTRLVRDWGRFIQVFTVEGRVNGWMVTRSAGEPKSPRWEETYALYKYFAVNDAAESDLAFQEQLDRAVVLFQERENLSFGEILDGITIKSIVHSDLGGVLCHVAECELTVSMYEHVLRSDP